MVYVPLAHQSTQQTPEQIEAAAAAKAERVGEPDPMTADSSTPIALAVLASLATMAALAGLIIVFT